MHRRLGNVVLVFCLVLVECYNLYIEIILLDSMKDDKEIGIEKEEERKVTDIPGIGPGIAAKLEAAGIYDLMGLAVLSPSSLADMAGVGEAVARKAIQAA